MLTSHQITRVKLGETMSRGRLYKPRRWYSEPERISWVVLFSFLVFTLLRTCFFLSSEVRYRRRFIETESLAGEIELESFLLCGEREDEDICQNAEGGSLRDPSQPRGFGTWILKNLWSDRFLAKLSFISRVEGSSFDSLFVTVEDWSLFLDSHVNNLCWFL